MEIFQLKLHLFYFINKSAVMMLCLFVFKIGGDFEVIKLSDFGLARATESTLETKTVLRGAWRYMAPEVMQHGKYSTRADVYSYGKRPDV